MIKIAIVGAEESKWTEEQKKKAKFQIHKLLLKEGIKAAKPLLAQQPDWPHAKAIKAPITLVSGHCPKGGVDIWAEIVATELGIKKEIYPAEVRSWEDGNYCVNCHSKVMLVSNGDDHWVCPMHGIDIPIGYGKGFRSRNIQIAEACDVLYDIEPKGSCRHCGGRGKIIREMKPSTQDILVRECKWCKGTGNYSGATWTKNYADGLGKQTQLIVIE